MSDPAFTNKELPPTESDIKTILASSYPYLQAVRKSARDIAGETTEEWKYYGKKSGWTMKTLRKKRNLFFIGIYPGYFRVTFVFGDKAKAVIDRSDVADQLKETLDKARKYAEGRGLPVVVESGQYLADIGKLIEIKIRN